MESNTKRYPADADLGKESTRTDRGKPQERFPYKPKVIHPTLHAQRISALIKRSVNGMTEQIRKAVKKAQEAEIK